MPTIDRFAGRFDFLSNFFEAKRLGRRVKLRPGWDDARIEVMQALVLRKFLDHPVLRERLLATEGRELIEGNTWNDRFWGECGGVGENHLGRILMDVRAHLAALRNQPRR